MARRDYTRFWLASGASLFSASFPRLQTEKLCTWLRAFFSCADEKHITENMGREGQLWRHGVRRNDRLLEVNDRNIDGMVGLSERNLNST